MLSIGICDDFPVYSELIEALIREYGEKNNLTFNIMRFGSGEELIEKLTGEDISFDLLFLDYHMKKLTGLETAKMIRQLEKAGIRPPCKIVFVTSTSNAYDLVSVNPLRIIQKTASPKAIEEVLDLALAEKCNAVASSNLNT